MIKKVISIIVCLNLATSCLVKQLWTHEETFIETIIGTAKIKEKDILIIIGKVNSYAVTENSDKILEAFQSHPNLGVDIPDTRISLDPDGLFVGYITLVTLDKAIEPSEQENLKKVGFEKKYDSVWAKRISVSGNVVEVSHKQAITTTEIQNKDIRVTLLSTKIDKVVKTFKTPVYLVGDAVRVAEGATLGVAAVVVVIPFLIIRELSR